VIQKFIGEISQIPPAYSAIKIKGKKAYELARKGEKPKLEPRKINIYNIKILNYEWPLLELTVQCSSGTYIRALARDIGRDLGCGAYLEKLIRTKIGKYSLTDAVTIDALRRK
jgi:tRNA pseudouridine55 synthase